MKCWGRNYDLSQIFSSKFWYGIRARFLLIIFHASPQAYNGPHSCSTRLAPSHVLPFAFCFRSTPIVSHSLDQLFHVSFTCCCCCYYLFLLMLLSTNQHLYLFLLLLVRVVITCFYCLLLRVFLLPTATCSFCYYYLCHCLLLPINFASHSRLFLSYWVWKSSKIFNSTEFENL